jgi:site-specific DNA-methyltransferase (adenine-specific)
MSMQNRTLYFGDNLDILREKFPDKSDGDGYFDLIYLDPPFNSSRDYNVLFKEGTTDSEAQVKAFEDSWHWTEEAQSIFEELVGVKKSKTKINEQVSNLMLALEKLVGHNDVLAYLTMMTIRLIELQRVLKKTGSIYLHCDPTASHYLKIVMDAIFGKKNFRNEIVWHYRRWSAAANQFQKMHDTIFWYSRGEKYIFTKPLQPYTSPEWIEDTVRGVVDGKLVRLKDEKGEYIKREKENKGVLMHDVWEDINFIAPTAKERLGYPTQKPEALLERIINASSKEGDWILDPFCGCGTTVSVAEKLDRKWVGIDITALAINLIKHRLRGQFSGKPMQVYVDGLPKDIAGAKSLFKKDPFEFEYWVLDLVNAMPSQSKTKENMRGADKGIDGVITFVRDVRSGKLEYGKILVQVKGGGVQRNDIATLRGDVEREKADGGLFITLEEPTRPMREEAVRAGKYAVSYSKEEFPKIQIITVKELLLGARPKMPLWSMPYYKEAKKVSYNPLQDQTRIEFL